MKLLVALFRTAFFGNILSLLFMGVLIMLFNDLILNMSYIFLSHIITVLIQGAYYFIIYLPLYLWKKETFTQASPIDVYLKFLPIVSNPFFIVIICTTIFFDADEISIVFLVTVLNNYLSSCAGFWLFAKPINEKTIA